MLTADQQATILAAVQYGREAIEVEFESQPLPPRLSRSLERLEAAALILLND